MGRALLPGEEVGPWRDVGMCRSDLALKALLAGLLLMAAGFAAGSTGFSDAGVLLTYAAAAFLLISNAILVDDRAALLLLPFYLLRLALEDLARRLRRGSRCG